jgi:hypothetical protein
MLGIHRDIQIIEDGASICSRTDAQLQKKFTLNWFVVLQNWILLWMYLVSCTKGSIIIIIIIIIIINGSIENAILRCP